MERGCDARVAYVDPTTTVLHMKVIGSGFGRTGTLSLQAALQQLGFGPCYHMVEVIKHRGHAKTWLSVARGESPDWRALFQKFQATVDFPACVYYAELPREFPQAKVVHSVRDKAEWYRSSHETIFQSRTVFPRWLRRASGLIDGLLEMTERIVWNGVFEGRFEDAGRAQQIFEEHTARVRATVPAENGCWYSMCAKVGRHCVGFSALRYRIRRFRTSTIAPRCCGRWLFCASLRERFRG